MLRAFKRVCNYVGEGGADLLALEPVPLDLSKAVCAACGAKGAMFYHSSYTRRYIWDEDGQVNEQLISVDCLRCNSCNRHHALLPLTVVPYLGYSITFIARVIRDWLEGAWPDIGALCRHFKISPKTFWLLRRRFSVCAVLAFGIASPRRGMEAAASIVLGKGLDAVDEFLFDFFERTGRSFCQCSPA